MSSILQSFRDVLHEHGLVPEEIITDGNLHRCPTASKPHKRNGAYIAHLDKPATLWWCNWETGEQETYCAEEKQTFSPSELMAWQERQRSIKRQREAECAKRHAEAAQQAKTEWETASPCNPEHLYLRKKGIAPLSGVRQSDAGCLLVPVEDDNGALQSMQRIYPDGSKRFLVGGKSGAAILSFRDNRKSRYQYAKDFPPAQASIRPQAGRFMCHSRQVILRVWPCPQKENFQAEPYLYAAIMTKQDASAAMKRQGRQTRNS